MKAFDAIHFSLHFGSSPWLGALSGECSRSCKFFWEVHICVLLHDCFMIASWLAFFRISGCWVVRVNITLTLFFLHNSKSIGLRLLKFSDFSYIPKALPLGLKPGFNTNSWVLRHTAWMKAFDIRKRIAQVLRKKIANFLQTTFPMMYHLSYIWTSNMPCDL